MDITTKINFIPHAYPPEYWKARTFTLAIQALHSTISSRFRASIFCPTRLLICRVRHWNARIEIARILGKSRFLKCEWHVDSKLVSVSAWDCHSNELCNWKGSRLTNLWFTASLSSAHFLAVHGLFTHVHLKQSMSIAE